MADLYGAPPSSDPEDFSSFLNQLLHNSSSSSTSSPLCMSLKSKYPNLFNSQLLAQSPPPFSQRREFTAVFSEEDRARSAASSSAVTSTTASLSGVNFLDPGGYIPSDAKECGDNAFSSSGFVDSGGNTSEKARGVFSENDLADFSGDSEKDAEGSEMPLDPAVPPRSSSKRRRAAEVHNLSEKRRRSRINEKMKALQNLIPNSNKTDKASMLDEAIEYLKQLQLQVQMLSLRNGLSLFPICFPEGVLQPPMQLPHLGTSFDARGGLASFTTPPNQHYTVQSNFNPSETSFRLGPYVDAHYEQFNLTTFSKENCKDGSSPKRESDNGTSPTADVS